MKIASALPKENANGLSPIYTKLINHPEQVHVIIALVDCSKLTTDTDTGDIDPTLRVLRVEAVTEADKPEAAGMIRAAIEKRTGATVLDGFEDDIDHDMKAAFGGAM